VVIVVDRAVAGPVPSVFIALRNFPRTASVSFVTESIVGARREKLIPASSSVSAAYTSRLARNIAGGTVKCPIAVVNRTVNKYQDKPMSQKFSAKKFLIPLVLPLVVTACGPSSAKPERGFEQSAPESEVNIQLPNFRELVQKEGPAVVNISTTQTVTREPMMPFGPQFPGLDEDHPFYDFFRRFAPQQQPPGPQEFETQSLGSEFVISDDGYVLTNAHVIGDADEITVKLIDGRELEAEVVGQDRPTDVALLKIDAEGLPVVPVGKADKSQVGDWVVAIGSPFGFDNTVTAGIISAKRRSLPGDTYVPFLQTDVALNPGNSGGPLFNMQGEVIGINSQIYSRTGGYMGLSFAIPIQLAMDIAGQLRDTGTVSRGKLGVQIQEVTPDLAESFGMDRPAGALVAAIEKGSAAARGGLRAGDVILSYNGQPVESMNELPIMVAATKPGEDVEVEVLRQGETETFELVVGAFESGQVASGGGESESSGGLGLVVSPLNNMQRQQAGVNGGLVVERAQGAAAKAGIQRGDIVLAVNNEQVRNIKQFTSLVESHKGGSIALLVHRGGNALYISVPKQG